ncbi:MAG TPA: hypothetical protein DDZ80_32795, partial [Cyanobacteria bacterium UBA8803]|nr:hypothetical protein [Cyanobacteria bacterium UBA9273]HBL62978.1 hypothetical protein [Cyanobacteria bacterium UBA8803]
MSHFNLKSLTFYGTAISSVVILFKVVTAYGNTNLKAPASMGGSYRIGSQNLPGCLQSDALVLDIQQSGIYLFGSLLPGDAKVEQVTSAKKKPTLSGQLINQQLSLEGSVTSISRCHSAVGAGEHNRVKIQGVVQGKTLVGQIQLNSTPALEFRAERKGEGRGMRD